MERIHRILRHYPSQERVASLLIRYGFSVNDGKVFCGPVEQSDSDIARAANVDRRAVRSAVEKISADPELSAIFSKSKPILLMSDLAHEIGCSVVEVTPTDANTPGILAAVTGAIYSCNLSIRQAVIDDSGDRTESKLIIVVDGEISPSALMLIKCAKGVAGVTVR